MTKAANLSVSGNVQDWTVNFTKRRKKDKKNMKFFLFLGFLAFAKGLRLEEGSLMEAEFEPIPTGPNTGCITCDDSEERYSCHGYAIIKTNKNGNEVEHGKFDQLEEDTVPRKIYELTYNNVFRGFRRATKIIETQGNCCWKFYERWVTFLTVRVHSSSHGHALKL